LIILPDCSCRFGRPAARHEYQGNRRSTERTQARPTKSPVTADHGMRRMIH
jgi:hypothetical protein